MRSGVIRTRVRSRRRWRMISWPAANGIRWVKPSSATVSPSWTSSATASASEAICATGRLLERRYRLRTIAGHRTFRGSGWRGRLRQLADGKLADQHPVRPCPVDLVWLGSPPAQPDRGVDQAFDVPGEGDLAGLPRAVGELVTYCCGVLVDGGEQAGQLGGGGQPGRTDPVGELGESDPGRRHLCGPAGWSRSGHEA